MPDSIARQTAIYAVITGDIVGSTNLSAAALARARKTLSETINRFAKRTPEAFISGPEFFRGDFWQVLLKEPRAALRLALLVQARLVAVSDAETRAAIGIGSVARLEKTLATSTGEAFTLSGRALEAITSSFRLTGALPARSGTLARWFPTLLHMCSGLMSGWTRRQAEVVGLWLSLPHPTHEAIAAKLDPPVTKQSVTDTLTSANWRSLYEPIKLFQETDWQSLSHANGAETADNASHAADRQNRLPNRLHKERKA